MLLKRTAEQIVNDELDFLVDGVTGAPPIKRAVHARPANWEIIADEANIYGTDAAIRTYKSVFGDATMAASVKRISRWRQDLKKRNAPTQKKAILAYSSAIDTELFDLMVIRRSAGIFL